MPLHLLSKKSWNVYNQDNRDRVARDEALAAASARDFDRQQRDAASASLISALRDGTSHKPPTTEQPSQLSEQDKLMIKATRGLTASAAAGKSLKDGKKRKRVAGEDDTDRDLRFAREEQDRRAEKAVARLRATKAEEADAPLVDGKGYINLFPEERRKSRTHDDKSRMSDLDREKKLQRDRDEEGGMSLKDAWGRKDPKGAWYLDKDGGVKDSVGRDVWGNEDPRRLERQARRVVSADPLAFMKRAQDQIKEGRRERDEREKEMRLSRSREVREYEDFSLDSRTSNHDHARHRDEHRKSHRRRHSRDRSRKLDRSRHGHRRSER